MKRPRRSTRTEPKRKAATPAARALLARFKLLAASHFRQDVAWACQALKIHAREHNRTFRKGMLRPKRRYRRQPKQLDLIGDDLRSMFPPQPH